MLLLIRWKQITVVPSSIVIWPEIYFVEKILLKIPHVVGFRESPGNAGNDDIFGINIRCFLVTIHTLMLGDLRALLSRSFCFITHVARTSFRILIPSTFKDSEGYICIVSWM